MKTSEVILYGVGDLGFGKGDPKFLISKAAPVLKQGDIIYGHLETSFSNKYDAPQRTVAFVPLRALTLFLMPATTHLILVKVPFLILSMF
jgi:hypothetical protein